MDSNHALGRRCRVIARCWVFAVFVALGLAAAAVAKIGPQFALVGG